MRWAVRSALLLLLLILAAVWAASLLEWLSEGEDLFESAIYGSILMPALVAPFAAIYLYLLYRLAQRSPTGTSRATAVLLSPLLYVVAFYNFGGDLFTNLYGLIYLAAPIAFGFLVPLPRRPDITAEPAGV